MDALASEGWAGKRAGSLVGQALGDALGFPVEGCSPAECASYVDSVLRRRPAVLPGRPPFPFGQYTDDTQLARELALSCVSGAFDGAAFGQRVATIFAEDRIVGRGRTTEAAALRLARGVPWQSAGTPAPAAGNGSAMRAAPIGWLHAIGPALVRDAVAQSRVTHADPRRCAGAVAIAGAVSLALREDHVDAGAWVATLGDFAAPIHAGFADEVRRLTDWLALSSDAAAPGIARAGFEPGVSPTAGPGSRRSSSPACCGAFTASCAARPITGRPSAPPLRSAATSTPRQRWPARSAAPFSAKMRFPNPSLARSTTAGHGAMMSWWRWL
jgi:hypothetical protein